MWLRLGLSALRVKAAPGALGVGGMGHTHTPDRFENSGAALKAAIVWSN